eukprot:Gb_06508 [translate_table: standard]
MRLRSRVSEAAQNLFVVHESRPELPCIFNHGLPWVPVAVTYGFGTPTPFIVAKASRDGRVQLIDDSFSSLCSHCEGLGELLFCEQCAKGFHLSCLGLDEALKLDHWRCNDCLQNKVGMAANHVGMAQMHQVLPVYGLIVHGRALSPLDILKLKMSLYEELQATFLNSRRKSVIPPKASECA